MPDYRPLPKDDLKFETQELRFQREMNGHNYLRWKDILATVDPNQTYEITEFGSLKEVKRGDEVLAYIWERMQDRKASFVNALKPVPADYRTPNEELWEKDTDPETGRVLVDFGENQWQLEGWFERATERQLKKHRLPDAQLDELTERVVQHRCRERRCDDQIALEAARSYVREEIQHSYAILRERKIPKEGALQDALFRSVEIFDRAYGRARMQNAGVDIEEHQDLSTWQAFYDRGFAPPTHEEMADYIIKDRGGQKGQAKREPIPDGTVAQQSQLDLGFGDTGRPLVADTASVPLEESPAPASSPRYRSPAARPGAKTKAGPAARRTTASSKKGGKAPAEIRRFAKSARKK